MNKKIGCLLFGITLMMRHAVAGEFDLPVIRKSCTAVDAGDSRKRAADLLVNGVIEVGGSNGIFRDVIDYRTGHYKRKVHTGPQEELSGFDGEPWVEQNGIVTQVDLPGLIADAKSRSFVMREAWCDPLTAAHITMSPSVQSSDSASDVVQMVPDGGNPVDLWVDRATHLIVRTVLHADAGDITTLYSEWRVVDRMQMPFRREEIDANGDHTVYRVKSASIRTRQVPDALLVRPRPQMRGRLGQTPRTVSFRLDAKDHGHIVTRAFVDGQPVELIFDTGAANYFTPDAATRLALATGGGVNLGGVGGGGVRGGFAKAWEIKIGSARLTDEAVIVGPLPFVATHPRAGMDIDGLTGYEFLAAFRTTVDYVARTLTFEKFGDLPNDQGVTIPFLSDEHNIYIEAQIEGVKGLFRIDTGDGGAVTVFKAFADAHGLFASGGRANTDAGGLGGTLATREFDGARLAIAGTIFDKAPVAVADAHAGSFASKSLAGNLGATILERFRITFDYHARTMTFQPTTYANRPFSRRSTGLSVTQSRPDRLEVLSVQPDSPAFRGNVRPKDAIVEIDGASVAENKLGVFDLLSLLEGTRAFKVTVERDGQLTDANIVPEAPPGAL